jgi:LysM repeat protein
VLNNLKSDLIIAGKKLKLPLKDVSAVSKTVKINKREYKVSDKYFNYNHLVKRYDNWHKIAKFYNVKLRSLLNWNNATKKTKLLVGDKLIIKMKTPILSNTDKINLRYVVNLGDTTNIVSTGFAISKKILLKTNNIKDSKYLIAGKNLIIVK